MSVLTCASFLFYTLDGWDDDDDFFEEDNKNNKHSNNNSNANAWASKSDGWGMIM